MDTAPEGSTKAMPPLPDELDSILARYRASFQVKVHNEENDDHDLLMDAFGISPELKRENRQYWGRELGMCWQLLVIAVCRASCADFSPARRFGQDEPYDLAVGNIAIDTKYRIGSGDSGTLKKFRSYGPMLQDNGLNPLLLIVRKDNLPAAITAVRSGGWSVVTGEASFDYVRDLTGFDLGAFLMERAAAYGFHH